MRFFLGATSKNGFHSLYEEWLEKLNVVYIIKGVPGGGKSKFMRIISKELENVEKEIEYITCSADPDSLDGVYFPRLSLAIADGTAPHVLEPQYPVAVDNYIDLSVFVSPDVRSHREEIVNNIKEHKETIGKAVKHARAANAAGEHIRRLALSGNTSEELKRRAERIWQSLKIGDKNAKISPKRRYLSSFSPKGRIVHWETVFKLCDKVYAINNDLELSSEILKHLESFASSKGISAISCLNPINGCLEHLLLPEARIGFISVTNSSRYPFNSYRHINPENHLPTDFFTKNRQKLQFLYKLKASALDDVTSIMANAKKIHDVIEKIYNPYIDFQGLTIRAENLAEELKLLPALDL